MRSLRQLRLAVASRPVADLGSQACLGAGTAGPGGLPSCREASRSSSQPQSAPLRRWAHSSQGYQTRLDLGWLYSPQATEEQQQGYLQGGGTGAGIGEAGAAPMEDQAPIENLAAGPSQAEGPGPFGLEDLAAEAELVAAQAELAAAADVEAGECSVCGGLLAEGDFYEAEFAEERQLVLRSSWLCAGAESMADMRGRLEERVRFLSDLEADGWVLEAPLDDEFACLRNVGRKPPHERRLRDAWAIAERWEEGVEWHRWPGPGPGPL